MRARAFHHPDCLPVGWRPESLLAAFPSNARLEAIADRNVVGDGELDLCELRFAASAEQVCVV